MDQDSIKALLKQALEPDTERVKEATTKLKRDYYKNPQSLGALLQIATDDDVANDVRQSAATQALPLVQRHWEKVPDGHKPQIRKHVLEATLEEEGPLVRHSCARVVAAIAKQDADDGEWADLPQTLIKVSTSSEANKREVGTYILFAILDTMAEGSTSQFGTLFQLYGKTIQDPESADVQINSMLGLSKMALYIDPDEDEKSLVSFQKLVPRMVAVLKTAMDAHDEERELQAFEVFQTLLEAPAPVLNAHFGDLVTFMIEAAAANSLDKDARVASLNFLVSCVMYRKTKFQALRVGEKVVSSLMEVLFTTEESVDDQEEYGLTMSVLTMLNLMSSQLPPSQAVVPVLDQFKKYASGESRQRQVVLMALGASVEGAPEFLDTQIEELKPYILQLLNDGELKVREQAVNATKELAEALPDSMAKDHEKFMAGLAKNLSAAMSGLEGSDGKTNLEVVVACCGAIDYLVDGMEPEALKQYLPELVPHMSKLFSHSDNKVQRASIAAVGSIAESAEKNFQPYFEDTMHALQGYIQLKDTKEELDIRNVTCDAMGDIALAVGGEAFQPYVQPLMRNTEDGLTLEDPSLKETSYLFWGKMAKVYKEDFKTFLPGVVKIIIEALEQTEADVDFDIEGDGDLVDAEVVVAGKKVKVVAASESDDDVGDWDDDDDDMDFQAISAVAQEKEFAAEALADIFSHTGKEFVPYYEKTITTILPLVESAYEGLRRAVASVLFRAYTSMWQLRNESWEAGLPVKNPPTGELAKFGEILMTTILAMWMAEDDPAVCMEIHRGLAETLKETGPAILAGEEVVQQCISTLLSIMQKKHLCQQTLDDDENEEEDEESSEDEQWLIESAMDAVAGLATALGSQFGEVFKIFQKLITGFASATEASQRSSAVGAIAEIVKGTQSGITPYTSSLLKIILHRLSDEDPEVKSNAAYAAGVLVEASDDSATITKAYNSILTKLEPMLQGDSEKRQRDNSAGALARMIMRHPDALPLSSILPAFVKLLPLEEDKVENKPCFDCLHQLFDQRNEVVGSLRGELKSVFDKALEKDLLDDETREKVQQMAKFV